MQLVTTNHTLELVLAGAVTANQLQFYVGYSDYTTSTLVAGAFSGVSNSATPVTLLGAPASSTYRQVNYLSIYNSDTAAATVTVRNDDGTDERVIVKCTIQVGETLEYSQQWGWQTITSGGLIKNYAISHFHNWPVCDTVGLQSGSIAIAQATTSNATSACWMGRAGRSYTQCILRYRVGTGAVTVTWGEAAVGTGSLTAIGSNVALTTRGYTDISGVITGTGNFSATISLTGIQPGDDLWCMLGHQSVTDPIWRCVSIAQNLIPGRNAAASTTRPSTMSQGREFTASANAIYPWMNAVFS